MNSILFIYLPKVRRFMKLFTILCVPKIDTALTVSCLTTYAAHSEGDIRLVGGSSPDEGRVEVYHNGQWGTVCHDQWDIIDATVVCRQLDYAMATSAPGQAAFGPGSGPIWYDDVDCSGTEMNLTQCLHTALGTHNCSHDEDAGVVCASKPGSCVCYCSI